MKLSFALVSLAFLSGIAGVAETLAQPASQIATAAATANPNASRATVVTSSGRGQAGYVHYFVITHPDDSLEYQVGIELEDQRMAWSVPNAGVIVSEFIKKGTLNANGTVFKVEHLYGIRPFSNDAQMRVLQKELTQRVAQWVDNETPYCLFRKPGEPFCLSCGDFVVRVLYPGFSPLVPSMPSDFSRGHGKAHTTDDLLMYFVGIYNLPDKHAKLARLAALDLPASMRADIATMIEDSEPDDALYATTVATTPLPTAPVAKPSAEKPAKSRIASRRPQSKKL
jgi:hypothetical protein